MKILFFSDIHGIKTNLNKLEKVINNNDFDKLVVLGDLYYNGFEKNIEFDNQLVYEFLIKYQDKLNCVILSVQSAQPKRCCLLGFLIYNRLTLQAFGGYFFMVMDFFVTLIVLTLLSFNSALISK